MVFNSLIPHHVGIKKCMKQTAGQEDGNETPLYTILHKYFLHKNPIVIHLNDTHSRLCTYQVDQLQFTLNYTEYSITEKQMQISNNITTRYMNRFDLYFMSPNKHFMVILSDVEWWNNNNRTIIVSLLSRHGNQIVFKEKALVVDYPVCVHSKSTCFSFIGKSLFLMPLIESTNDVFIDEIVLSEDLLSSKKPIVYKQRIQLKLQEDVVSSSLDHFVALSRDTYMFQNKTGVILYSVDKRKFGPYLNMKKSIYCREYIHKGVQFVIAIYIDRFLVTVTLYRVDHDKKELKVKENFDVDISFLKEHYKDDEQLVIFDFVFSSFLGFRMYLLLKGDILVIDLLQKCCSAHLKLSQDETPVSTNRQRINHQEQIAINRSVKRDLLVSDNGREIVYIESLGVQVFYLEITIYSEMSLKYLCGLAVNRYLDKDDIEKLCIPLNFKTYLLS